MRKLICLLLSVLLLASMPYSLLYAENIQYSSYSLTTTQYKTALAYYKANYTSEHIRILQNRLNELGYKCNSTIGTIDNDTIDAVYSFQKDNKLTADGIAGTKTLKTLSISYSIPVGNNVSTSNNVKVKFVNHYMDYNDHVGNEWGTSVEINGKDLDYGNEISVSLTNSNSIKITVYATEFDSIPDNSSNTKYIKLKDLKDGVNKIIVNTTVRENRGRYSGNTAKWSFEFEIRK